MNIFVGYTDEWGEDNLFGLFKSESEVIDFAHEKFDNAEIVDSGSVDTSCSWRKFEFDRITKIHRRGIEIGSDDLESLVKKIDSGIK